MSITTTLTQFRRWGIKGMLSIVDQGIFSGANFLISIALARWLLSSEYGVYAIVFSVYQIGFQLQGALILEPMSVIGPARLQDNLTEYIRSQIKVHFILFVAIGMIIVPVSMVVIHFHRFLGDSLTVMGLVLGFMLFPLLLRRSFYVLGKPEIALLGSVIYALAILGSLWLFYLSGLLSVNLAFITFAIGGIISGLLLASQLSHDRGIYLSVYDTLIGNLKYGKWLIISAILIAIAAQTQTVVAGILVGLDAAGAFRAMQNIIQPVILVFSALCAIALPSLAFEYGHSNYGALLKKAKILLILLFIIAILFELLLCLWNSDIEYLFYKGNYKAYAVLIPLWGLIPIAGVLTFGYYYLLQAIQKPQVILWGSLIWMVTSVGLSLILTMLWGMKGAIISSVGGYVAGGGGYAIFFHYYIKKLV